MIIRETWRLNRMLVSWCIIVIVSLYAWYILHRDAAVASVQTILPFFTENTENASSETTRNTRSKCLIHAPFPSSLVFIHGPLVFNCRCVCARESDIHANFIALKKRKRERERKRVKPNCECLVAIADFNNMTDISSHIRDVLTELTY